MREDAQQDQDIDFIRILRITNRFSKTIWEDRRIIAKITILTCTLGLAYAISVGVEYTAQTKLLPYRAGQGGLSGLSGIANLAGLRIPAAPTDQSISADLYPELTKSRDFRITVAEIPLRFGYPDTAVTFQRYFENIYEAPLTTKIQKYTVGLPNTLRLMMAKKGETAQAMRRSNGGKEKVGFYGPTYIRTVNLIKDRLQVSIDRKTSIITITGTMPDAYAAADLVEKAAGQLMQRIIEIESGKAKEQFAFISAQYDIAKNRLDSTQVKYATYADKNRSVAIEAAQIRIRNLQSEYELASELVSQLAREKEQQRIKMNHDTPVFTVLERATVPNEKSAPNRGRIFGISLLVGILASGISIIVSQIKSLLKAKI